MIQMFIWKSELTLQETSIISLVEEQKFLFCNQHYELNVFSLLISLLQPIDTGGIKLNADFWSNFEWFPSKIVHCFFGNVSWPPRSPFLAIERVFFFGPSIHTTVTTSHFIRVLDPSRDIEIFCALHQNGSRIRKKRATPLGVSTLRLSRILKVARRLEVSLSVSKPPLPTDDGDFFRNRAVSCCRDQREVLCGRSSLPCVRVFLILKHCSKGRFPAKKHIVNGRDTIDGRNPVNHLACINLVNL